jgi:hypothetical protein
MKMTGAFEKKWKLEFMWYNWRGLLIIDHLLEMKCGRKLKKRQQLKEKTYTTQDKNTMKCLIWR